MRKVLVIGSGGAGKSTFARRLGELLGVEVIHLDRCYWRAGWVKTPSPEWLEKVKEMVRGDAWIMDGNYSATLDVRFAACDTLIFLDIARTLCLWRIFKRAVRYRKQSRPDMAEGCPEQLTMEFILWVWNYSSRTRPKVVELLKSNGEGKNIVWLRSPAEVENFLARVADAS